MTAIRDVQQKQLLRLKVSLTKPQAIGPRGCRHDCLTEQALSEAALVPLHQCASPKNITANTTRETDTGTVENGRMETVDHRSRR